ncbi:MAG: O-antigen ligase family protein, partial [Giesbergeria sp.]
MTFSLAAAQRAPWPEKLSSVAAFAVPGLALWLPSGYSYGAVLLLLGALLTLHRWPRQPHDAFTWWFGVSMLAMAVLWALQADPAEHFGRADRPAKYALGALCLLFVTVYPPKPRALLAGLVVGSLGAGGIAVWQMYGLHAERAWGHTNAIQYGNLALCLAAMLALYAGAVWSQLGTFTRLLCILGVAAGLDASVLSQSRGGWLALVLALPLLLGWLMLHRRQVFRIVAVGVAAMVLVLAVANSSVLVQRWDRMEQEVTGYGQHGDAGNSVGQRLEHWRFAWDIARERPLLGWGFAGYMAEKAKRVEAGLYHPSIVEYKFVHNELLDQWVKLGVLGPAVLLLFYGLPLAMFLPLVSRMQSYRRDPQVGAHALALRLCG